MELLPPTTDFPQNFNMRFLQRILVAKIRYNRCFGSKNNIIRSGSRNLLQFRSGSDPFHTVTLSIWKKKNCTKLFFLNVFFELILNYTTYTKIMPRHESFECIRRWIFVNRSSLFFDFNSADPDLYSECENPDPQSCWILIRTKTLF